jgi:hypothetical protein
MRRRSAPLITVTYEELPRTTQLPPTESHGYQCDLCERECQGTPCGSGLLLWFRGTEMRYDEPPLCEDCASRVTMGALSKWALEGEEEG